METLPKIAILTPAILVGAVALGLPIEAIVIVLMVVYGLLLDVLFFQYDRNREAMLWFLDHVQLTDKPIKESDAPESVKKLVRRGGERRNG